MSGPADLEGDFDPMDSIAESLPGAAGDGHAADADFDGQQPPMQMIMQQQQHANQYALPGPYRNAAAPATPLQGPVPVANAWDPNVQLTPAGIRALLGRKIRPRPLLKLTCVGCSKSTHDCDVFVPTDFQECLCCK